MNQQQQALDNAAVTRSSMLSGSATVLVSALLIVGMPALADDIEGSEAVPSDPATEPSADSGQAQGIDSLVAKADLGQTNDGSPKAEPLRQASGGAAPSGGGQSAAPPRPGRGHTYHRGHGFGHGKVICLRNNRCVRVGHRLGGGGGGEKSPST